MILRLLVFVVLAVSVLTASSSAQPNYTYRTVDTGYVVPWEIEFGPDGWLWVSERAGYMSRLNLETGERRVLLDLSDSVLFERVELGMLGFTWHPDFPDSPYVYVASTYGGSAERTYRLVERFRYENDSLVDPVEINRLDPGFRIHQGCRLKIGHDRKLYVTTGDSPGPELAVEDDNIVGKVLRLNLDGSIPDDNPIPGTYTYTKGHRNVQGWVQLPSGVIFTAEHGSDVEDEVNRLQPGANHGWPFVEGPCDEIWEEAYCDSVDVVPPFWSSGLGGTVAPCGLDYYDHERYPALRNSLLMATLKYSTIYQFRLNEDQTAILDTIEHLNRAVGRIRDFAIHPDGRVFFCTSNNDANSYYPFPMSEDDRILELIPTAANGTAERSIPDTLYTQALPGDEHLFPIPVTNTGTASFRVTGVWQMDTSAPVSGDEWRGPMVIVPGTTYSVGGLFAPTEPGEWVGTVKILTDSTGNKDVKIVANTWVGQLDPVEDTTVVTTDVETTRTVDITFENVGFDTVTVDSVMIEGPDAELFAVEGLSHTVVDSTGSTTVTLRFSPKEAREHLASIRLRSNSFRDTPAVVRGTSTIVSVLEARSAHDLRLWPNPASRDVRIEVPHHISTGTITVTDLMGTVVYTTSLHSAAPVRWTGHTLSGNLAAPGLYLVTLTTPTGVYQSPLQLMR